MLTEARERYFNDKIVGCGHNYKDMNRIVKHLMGVSAEPVLALYSCLVELAEHFSSFFEDKITKIRDGIGRWPVTSHRVNKRVCSGLSSFAPATLDEIRKLMNCSANKSCALDPIPTWLTKECTEELLPLITNIVNSSLSEGVVPGSLKMAHITPLIKKAGLDPEVEKNFRPVSNLSFLSKLLERVVSVRLDSYLGENSLSECFQSAYTKFHSTETSLKTFVFKPIF